MGKIKVFLHVENKGSPISLFLQHKYFSLINSGQIVLPTKILAALK